MIGNSGGALLGEIKAVLVSGRGFSPEEVADMALEKIMYVGENSHPAIRDQAQAFRDNIRVVLVRHMNPELIKLLED